MTRLTKCTALQRNRVAQPCKSGLWRQPKLGYRYAIDEGFDCIILLHGDGQYDPGMIPQFVEQYHRTSADVVLGSWMHRLQSAAQGSVPVYKMMGRFSYGERGILDITPKRLFTKHTLLSTLDECGYDIATIEGIGVPFEAVFGGRLGRLPALSRLPSTVGVKQRLLDSEILFGVPADQTQEGQSPQASPVKETAHD
jgi:hypothetical protein